MNLKFYSLHRSLSWNKIILPFVVACVLLTSSCNIINPAEPIPAYVQIDSFSLSTDVVTQGSNSANIVDAWIFVDGNAIGAFELPCTIPVLYSGSHKLTIRPGILIDGIAATRTIYPFYSGFDTVVNFESEKTVNAFPKIEYLSTANLTHIEDFEHLAIGISNLARSSASDTLMMAVQSPISFEGSSAAVYLDDAHPYFECAWKDSFLLPLGRPAYVELNYKSDNEFTVGISTYTTSGNYSDEIVTFRTSDTWKKQYVSLGPIIENSITATGYKIYIKATKSSSFATATLYFDNIKVVY